MVFLLVAWRFFMGVLVRERVILFVHAGNLLFVSHEKPGSFGSPGSPSDIHSRGRDYVQQAVAYALHNVSELSKRRISAATNRISQKNALQPTPSKSEVRNTMTKMTAVHKTPEGNITARATMTKISEINELGCEQVFYFVQNACVSRHITTLTNFPTNFGGSYGVPGYGVVGALHVVPYIVDGISESKTVRRLKKATVRTQVSMAYQAYNVVLWDTEDVYKVCGGQPQTIQRAYPAEIANGPATVFSAGKIGMLPQVSARILAQDNVMGPGFVCDRVPKNVTMAMFQPNWFGHFYHTITDNIFTMLQTRRLLQRELKQDVPYLSIVVLNTTEGLVSSIPRRLLEIGLDVGVDFQTYAMRADKESVVAAPHKGSSARLGDKVIAPGTANDGNSESGPWKIWRDEQVCVGDAGMVLGHWKHACVRGNLVSGVYFTSVSSGTDYVAELRDGLVDMHTRLWVAAREHHSLRDWAKEDQGDEVLNPIMPVARQGSKHGVSGVPESVGSGNNETNIQSLEREEMEQKDEETQRVKIPPAAASWANGGAGVFLQEPEFFLGDGIPTPPTPDATSAPSSPPGPNSELKLSRGLIEREEEEARSTVRVPAESDTNRDRSRQRRNRRGREENISNGISEAKDNTEGERHEGQGPGEPEARKSADTSVSNARRTASSERNNSKWFMTTPELRLRPAPAKTLVTTDSGRHAFRPAESQAAQYSKTEGRCRGGNVFSAKDTLRICHKDVSSKNACAAKCNLQLHCQAFDFPNTNVLHKRRGVMGDEVESWSDKQCCLFGAGSVGDGHMDKGCYVRESSPTDGIDVISGSRTVTTASALQPASSMSPMDESGMQTLSTLARGLSSTSTTATAAITTAPQGIVAVSVVDEKRGEAEPERAKSSLVGSSDLELDDALNASVPQVEKGRKERRAVDPISKEPHYTRILSSTDPIATSDLMSTNTTTSTPGIPQRLFPSRKTPAHMKKLPTTLNALWVSRSDERSFEEELVFEFARNHYSASVDVVQSAEGEGGNRIATSPTTIVEAPFHRLVIQRVHMSELKSWDHTTRLLQNTHVFIGVSGAAFTNQLWLPRGAVIVLFDCTECFKQQECSLNDPHRPHEILAQYVGNHVLHYMMTQKEDYITHHFPQPDAAHFWAALSHFFAEVDVLNEAKVSKEAGLEDSAQVPKPSYQNPAGLGESLLCDTNHESRKMRCIVFGSRVWWEGPDDTSGHRYLVKDCPAAPPGGNLPPSAGDALFARTRSIGMENSPLVSSLSASASDAKSPMSGEPQQVAVKTTNEEENDRVDADSLGGIVSETRRPIGKGNFCGRARPMQVVVGDWETELFSG